MNDETLLVASIGLCLGMVVLATHMGFSAALGAFIMGSLIAEASKCRKNRTSRQTGQRSVWSCLLCISRYAC